MEPPPLAADVPQRQDASRPGSRRPAAGPSFDLSSRLHVRSPEPRSTLASAGIAACLVGLLGADAGLVWLVAGVWSVRAMAQTPIGVAWGVACLGVGVRWGTLSLGDVAVATRLNGPTLTSGTLLVRIGMMAALAGALAGEMRSGGFSSRTWGERAAAAAAILALIPLFIVRGPGDPQSMAPVLWGVSAAVGTALVVFLRPVSTRLPSWGPVVLAAAGVTVASAR